MAEHSPEELLEQPHAPKSCGVGRDARGINAQTQYAEPAGPRSRLADASPTKPVRAGRGRDGGGTPAGPQRLALDVTRRLDSQRRESDRGNG